MTSWKLSNGLILLILFSSIIAILNFQKAINFQYADWDGFQYLSYSKALLSGNNVYKDPIRSPILGLLILPDLVMARLEMILLHLFITISIYYIAKSLTKNENASLFAAFFYSVNWWIVAFLVSTLSDLFAMAFFLASLICWLRDEKRNMIYAGIFAGLSFITRFDAVILLLPMMFYTLNKKFRYEFFTPLILISIPVEIVTSYFVFGRFVYPPIEFLNLNFVYGLAPILAGPNGSNITFVLGKMFELSPLLVVISIFSLYNFRDSTYRKILSIFAFSVVVLSLIPIPDNRIFIVKLIPLIAILSAYTVLSVSEKLRKPLSSYLLVAVGVIYLLYNLILIFSIQYPNWKLSETPCNMENICTNAPPIINYYCEKNAVDIHQFGNRYAIMDSTLNKTFVVLYNIGKCSHLIYYNISFGYDDYTNDLIKNRYKLENETSFVLIYDLRGSI